MTTEQLPSLVLFSDIPGGEVLGWAGVRQPGELVFQAEPARPQVAQAILGWFLEQAGGDDLAVEVNDADDPMLAVLLRAGFREWAAPGPVYGMFRTRLGPAPSPPTGYQVRAVRPEETPQRVAVHRAAWDASSLPWPAEHRPAPEDLGPPLSFEQALDREEGVRRTWLYDMDFDLVAVANTGEFVGCCIVWLDPDTGVAEIEPLGVVPEHRRRGLAVALCHEAVSRVAQAGGCEVFINTGPRLAYPVPAAAYVKAGFGVVTRGRAYLLHR